VIDHSAISPFLGGIEDYFFKKTGSFAPPVCVPAVNGGLGPSCMAALQTKNQKKFEGSRVAQNKTNKQTKTLSFV